MPLVYYHNLKISLKERLKIDRLIFNGMKKYIVLSLLLLFTFCTPLKELKKENEVLNDSVAKLLKQIELLKDQDGDGVPDYVDVTYEVDPKTHHLVGASIKHNAPTIVYRSVSSAAPSETIESTQYNLGYLTYYIPDTMKVGVRYRIELRITKYKTVEFTAKLDTHRVEAQVRIAHKMEAKLTDIDKAFNIVTDNTPEQSVEMDKSFTRWIWFVTPIKSGSHELKMVVVIKENDLVKDIPVYENSIYIKSAPLYTTKGFFEQYWQWLIGTFVVPLCIWWYNKKKKKKSVKV